MADVRLIDANVLNTSVALYAAENAYLNDTPLDILRMMSRWIAEAHTIDAVPVVRCKYCMNATKLCDGLPTGKVACLRLLAEMPDDGFCHNGAKMDAKYMDVPTKDGGAEDAGR